MSDDKRPTQEEIAKVRAIFRAQEDKRREFAGKYGDMKPPTVIKVGDKLMSVVEGGIYMQTQEDRIIFQMCCTTTRYCSLEKLIWKRKKRNRLMSDILRFNGCTDVSNIVRN